VGWSPAVLWGTRAFPHIAEHNDPQRGGERNSEDAAQQTAEQGGADHHSDNNRYGVQADAADDLDLFVAFPGSEDRLILIEYFCKDAQTLFKFNDALAAEPVESLRQYDTTLPALDFDGGPLEQLAKMLSARLVRFYTVQAAAQNHLARLEELNPKAQALPETTPDVAPLREAVATFAKTQASEAEANERLAAAKKAFDDADDKLSETDPLGNKTSYTYDWRGNVLTVRDALSVYSADQLRMFLLGRHYRKDMNLKGIDFVARRHTRLRGMAEKALHAAGGASEESDEELLRHFCDAMNDDFNTPLALRVMGEGLASALNTRSAVAAGRKLASVRTAGKILGIDLGIG
jgi:YD repeat-containing protein